MMLDKIEILTESSSDQLNLNPISISQTYATGRRKMSIARVWIRVGSGKIIINGQYWKEYFKRVTLQVILHQPLISSNFPERIDVIATATGGGLSGQAGAIRHGISRALVILDPSLQPKFRSFGFLTRDSRSVERKKYGRPKARKSFQFSKR